MLDIAKLLEALQQDEEGLSSYLSNPADVKKYGNGNQANPDYKGCVRVTHFITPHKFIPLIFYFFGDTDFLVINGNEV